MDLHRSHPVPRPHIQPHAEGQLPAAKLLPQVRGTVSIHVCVCMCVCVCVCVCVSAATLYVCIHVYVCSCKCDLVCVWCMGTCETLSRSSILP